MAHVVVSRYAMHATWIFKYCMSITLTLVPNQINDTKHKQKCSIKRNNNNSDTP